jgi:alpha-amylase
MYRGDQKPVEVLFQGFPWNATVNGQKHVWYRHMATKAKDLGSMGITHVWFPPAQRSVAPQGYLPGDYYDLGHGEELGHNRTLYGNEKELKETIKAFKKEGIESIADIVVNHRCGSHQDDNGNWNIYHHPSGKMMWEQWAITSGDTGGTGAPDTGSDFAAAPDIDHTDPRVRDDICTYLNWLKDDIGFDGFRFDFTKGYDPSFVKEYIERTSPDFAIGEYWTSMHYEGGYLLPGQDGHRQELCDWLDGCEGTSRTFDFTTKGLLQCAFSTGEFYRLKDKDEKAAGLIGWWADKAVTFIDNHDTGSEQAHWLFPGQWVLGGYAYILTHPGTPTIFWDHLYACGDKFHDGISKMVSIRKEMGINRTSQLIILIAVRDQYVAEIDGKVIVRLGTNENYRPSDSWNERIRGNGFAIWTK